MRNYKITLKEVKVMGKWEKPELTVLARNKPEEAVLQACKTETGGGPSQSLWPDEDSGFCEYPGGAYDDCVRDAAS